MTHPYDPTIQLPKLAERDIRISTERRNKDRLLVCQERVQRLFQPSYRAKLTWGRQKLSLGPEAELELIKLTKTSVQFHPILAHEKVPDDVLEAAVLLGMLLRKCSDAQNKRPTHPIRYPVLAEWVSQNMALLPSSEFLRMFLERFGVWVAKVN